MARTVIDIDDEALSEAMEALGTKTKVATVNAALREIGARQRRMAFLDHMRDATDDLGDSEVMRGAWQ